VQSLLLVTHVLSQQISSYINISTIDRSFLTFDDNSKEEWLGFVKDLRSSEFIKSEPKLSASLSRFSDKQIVEKILLIKETCLQHKIKMLFSCDPDYPYNLRQIEDFPHILFVRGKIEVFKNKSVSVIGSRRASSAALRTSAEIGRSLAEYGTSVVSGGAYGCDIAAQRGMLETSACQIKAITVFPGSLLNLYPRGNFPVFRLLRTRDAVFISEKLLSYNIYPWDFVVRNRIISGLSLLTVVMDARIKSGAMTTAKSALDQGREVWVYHPLQGKITEGIASLIEEGALSFRSSDEFMDLAKKNLII
jgi:DNA processing protein